MRKQINILAAGSIVFAFALFLSPRVSAQQNPPSVMKAVGVLGNSSGLNDLPVPFAMYTGIAADDKARIYLAGAPEGIVVTDKIGKCLTVITLPDNKGCTIKSLAAFIGGKVFVIAIRHDGAASALYSADTSPDDPKNLSAVKLDEGPGHWALSPTPDDSGRVVVGKSIPEKLSYSVEAFEPKEGKPTVLFSMEMPKGATRPWRHFIQAEPGGAINLAHAGGVNWDGLFKADGTRIGNALPGQLFENYRYIFGYSGNISRMSADGKNSEPGDCGARYEEPRMFTQITKSGNLFYISGRGGATVSAWKDDKFTYKRRIGGIYIEDFALSGSELRGIAYQLNGSLNVPHVIHIPAQQAIGEPLDVAGCFHDRSVKAVVPVHGKGLVCVYQKTDKKIGLCYSGPDQGWQYDVETPEIKSIGQAAVLGKDILIADPVSGTIWTRPILDKAAPVKPWKTGVLSVTGLSVLPDGSAIFAATPTKVLRISQDGTKIEWENESQWKGIRRIAATMSELYVCDQADHVVDKLDVKNGSIIARLGVFGESGPSIDHLNAPHAVAADANGVFIADNGNGRILIAATSAWRPDIKIMPVDDDSPVKAVQISVNLPEQGRMSLNIYNPENDLTVRQLVCAGDSSEPVIWDGIDMFGEWVKPGTYRYHGTIVPKFSLRYITSVSQSGNPPYRTADGKGSWGGVWYFVTDICPVTSAPDSDIVVLWGFEEGEGGLIRMSQDGEVRWKQHLAWWMKATMTGVCSDGTDIYIAGASAMNAASGAENYSGKLNRPFIWRVSAENGAMKLYSKDQDKQPMFGEYKEAKGVDVVSDIEFSDGMLYITAPAQDSVFVADAASGKLLDTWKIPQASGIAFKDKVSCFVGSGQKILSVTPADGKTANFADAKGVVRDITMLPDGKIAASVGGPRHQLVFFDQYGKELMALGQSGGRPLCGRMIRESFLKPTGLCATANGKIFIAEEAAPKRFTRWSADGRLEREFQGPYYYSGMFGIDEEIPEHIYADTHGDIIRYTVDYANGKWDVDSYWIGVYDPESGDIGPKWWPRIRHHDGKVWWCGGSGAIVQLDETGFRYISRIYTNWVEKTDEGDYKSSGRKKTGLKGTWSDLNGDGKMQSDEWQVTSAPGYPIDGSGPQQGWGMYFDPQFNLYMHDWSDDSKGGIWKMPVAEWNNGVPVYKWEQATHVGLNRTGGLVHGAAGARSAFAYGGKTFGFNGGYNAKNLPGVGHGRDWEFAQISCYEEATGKPLWHAGERAPGFIIPGQHYCPTGPSGVVGEYLFWTDENSLVHAWDIEKGLYVDTLLEDISRNPNPSPYTVWVELFNTRVFTHPKTGKVYLLAASDAIHIFEVLGTDKKMQRFSGEFQLTEKDIESAKAQLAAKSSAKTRELKIKKVLSQPPLDGNPANFAGCEAATMVLNNDARGTARLMADGKNLYVCFDVKDSSPWKNGGSDISTLFKTGDEVSIWLGPDNKKRRPDEKDVRVMFSPTISGKNAVVAFRPKWPKAPKPVPFKSPSGEVTMDCVEELPDAKCVVKTADDGYVLQASVPLADIGLSGDPVEFGLDLSITFSDPSGTLNNARFHWGRNGAAMVFDLPSEARLEPETWGTGTIK